MNPKNKKDTSESPIFKAADISTNFALSFIPGGNVTYEFLKLTAKQLKKYTIEKRENRIIDFHRLLLESNTNNDIDNVEAYIEIADFHVLLNTCLQDAEDEKTELYATLAQNAIYRKLPPEDLRFFCLSLSEMTHGNLEDMRRAYIASEFHLIPKMGAGRVKIDLSSEQASSRLIYGRRQMELRGFVEKGEINQYGRKFIQTCYPSDQLLPRSIQMAEWKNANSPILMLSYEISSPYITKLYNLLSEQLKECGFQTSGLAAPQSRRISLSLITISIVIFKEHPERVINNINNIDHLMGEYSIAVQGCKDYPTVLDPLRDRFKKIINISNNDLQTAVTKIISSIKEL